MFGPSHMATAGRPWCQSYFACAPANSWLLLLLFLNTTTGWCYVAVSTGPRNARLLERSSRRTACPALPAAATTAATAAAEPAAATRGWRWHAVGVAAKAAAAAVQLGWWPAPHAFRPSPGAAQQQVQDTEGDGVRPAQPQCCTPWHGTGQRAVHGLVCRRECGRVWVLGGAGVLKVAAVWRLAWGAVLDMLLHMRHFADHLTPFSRLVCSLSSRAAADVCR